MNKKEIKQWDDHLFKQRKELGIDTFRNPTADGKGSFRIEVDEEKLRKLEKLQSKGFFTK